MESHQSSVSDEVTARTRDLEARIIEHPLVSVGLAFALGAIVALGSTRRRAEEGARFSLRGAIGGAMAAIGLRLARELALGQLSEKAKRWYQERTHGSERATSTESPMERFAEH